MDDIFDGLFKSNGSKNADLLHRVLSNSTITINDAVALADKLDLSLTISAKAKNL